VKKPRATPPMPPPERRVVLCVIGAPHGVRGEARVKAFTADPLAIGDYGPLYAADGRVFEIADGRFVKDDMLVVRLVGITDRDEVAKLTHTELFVDRAMLPPPDDEEEFYHADLIGLPVVDLSGEALGTIHAVHDFGAGDMLEIRPLAGGGTWLQPFTKVAVPKVEIAEKRVSIDPEFLQKPEPPRAEPGAPRPPRMVKQQKSGPKKPGKPKP